MRYLTFADAERLVEELRSILSRHQALAPDDFVFLAGGRGRLESALALPGQNFFGLDPYPSIADKAAVLMRSLCANHAFVQGNKRFASYAVEVFLNVNGYELGMTNVEYEALIHWVSSTSPVPTVAEISEWFAVSIRATTPATNAP